MARKKKPMYRSGYCAYAPHQHPCKGEFGNGAGAGRKVTLCSCECHGDYEARLIAAGQKPPPEEVEEDDGGQEDD